MSKAEQRRRSTVCDTVLAEWIGLTLHQLHILHPEGFGAPRHFAWDGRHYCYTAAGMRALAHALREAGQGPAAARLEAKLGDVESEETTPAQELGLRICA